MLTHNHRTPTHELVVHQPDPTIRLSESTSSHPLMEPNKLGFVESTGKLWYQINELNTRSVMLFSNGAQVSREIEGINLKVKSLLPHFRNIQQDLLIEVSPIAGLK